MKKIMSLILGALLSGCVSNVSTENPHDKLVGTSWRLTQDLYITEYLDTRGKTYLYPPDEYNEYQVGNVVHGKIITGVVRTGEILMITDVLKERNFEIGNMYYPMMTSSSVSSEIGDKALNGYWLYRGFSDAGVLNPEFVEKVK